MDSMDGFQPLHRIKKQSDMKTFSLLFCAFATIALNAQQQGFPEARKQAVTEVMKKHVSQGIPGLALTVYSPSTGYWSHAEGVSDLERQTPMQPEHLFYLQSIAKTYMAVAILQLMEQNKLKLDDPVLSYLNYPWLSRLEGIEKVTIRMLLNHTSGLPEYSTDPILVSRILHDPLTVLDPEDMLSCIGSRPMDFEPGSRYSYRNTNYELLSLIADRITGDHQAYIQQHIFDKLGLEHTHILNRDNYREIPGIVEAYWDVLLESKPVNVSGIQRANVASMKGDDGMVASTRDAVDFLVGLVDGKLLKSETLDEMQQWVTNEDGEPVYGLGVIRYDLDVTYGIGHSGGGIGAGCVLMYLPELNAAVFMATNFNTMMESPIRKRNEDMQMNLLQALFAD